MVLPIILGVAVAVLAIGWLITWYRQPPKEENKTIREIEERLQKEEERVKKEADRQEEERKKIEQLVALRREREHLAEERERRAKERAESAEKERRQNEERKKKSSWDAKEVEKEAARSMAEREKQLSEEKQRLQEVEKEMKERERELEEEARIAKELAETERAARLQMENGLQPIRWPTREEFQRGRELIQYDKKNLHFAIIGKSGSGKSSLINAFMNRNPGQLGAAATGVTETTSAIERYPDPGLEAPRPWTVWYDVPGAGTQNISAWQYFINQGLFVFDIILIAIGDRFEETDIQLLKDCHRFKIPALIVRSKADMHIDNLVKEDGGWGERIDPQSYQRCRKTFITQSKLMVRNELAKAGLDDQEVYLVSSYTLREVYNRALDGSEADLPFKMIDEKILIRALMWLTIQRRSGNDGALQSAVEVAMKGTALMRNTAQAGRDVRSKLQAASSRTWNAVRHPGRKVDDEEATHHQGRRADDEDAPHHQDPKVNNEDAPRHQDPRVNNEDAPPHQDPRVNNEDAPPHQRPKVKNEDATHHQDPRVNNEDAPHHQDPRVNNEDAPRHQGRRVDNAYAPRHQSRRVDDEYAPRYQGRRADYEDAPRHQGRRVDNEYTPRHQDRRVDGEYAARHQGRRARGEDTLRHQNRRVDDQDDILPEAPPQYQELQPEQDTGNVRPRSGSPNHPKKGKFIVWIKHVIYLRKPVTFHQLQRELTTCNPNFARISAAPPRLLSPKVAVLNFLPGKMIPEEVEAFGSFLSLKPYRERGRQDTNSYDEPSAATESHNQPPHVPHTRQRGETHQPVKKSDRYRKPAVEDVEDSEDDGW